jgi:quercetin dioxygenase-like cupin family protein
MQQIKSDFCIFVLTSILLLNSCSEPAPAPVESNADTVSKIATNESSSMPAYDPAMDPLTVGAEFSKKLGDTLNIKMYEMTLKPGDSAKVHTHPDHTFYVLQGGKLAVTFQGKGRQVLDLKPGMAAINGSLSDAARNVGNTTIKMLIHDIYRPRGK